MSPTETTVAGIAALVLFVIPLAAAVGYTLGLTRGRYEQEVKRREDIEYFAGLRRQRAAHVAPGGPEPEEIAVARAEEIAAERERLDTEIVTRMAKDFTAHGLTQAAAEEEARRIVRQGLGT